MKKYLWMSSAAVVIGALRVKNQGFIQVFWEGAFFLQKLGKKQDIWE